MAKCIRRAIRIPRSRRGADLDSVTETMSPLWDIEAGGDGQMEGEGVWTGSCLKLGVHGDEATGNLWPGR